MGANDITHKLHIIIFPLRIDLYPIDYTGQSVLPLVDSKLIVRQCFKWNHTLSHHYSYDQNCMVFDAREVNQMVFIIIKEKKSKDNCEG